MKRHVGSTQEHQLLSDIVAEQVRKRRRALKLNRDQLAERCAARGLPLSASAIANIESGRRDRDGRRRREISIDELIAFALALDIAPVLLVVPIGQEATSQLLDTTADTWDAVRWFGGHADLAPGDESYRLPVQLYEGHDQAQVRLRQARSNARALRENPEAGGLLRMTEEIVTQTAEILRQIRQQMRDRGLTLPPLADQAAREIGRGVEE